jgi:hypothetical protein
MSLSKTLPHTYQTQMTFKQALLSANYVLDENNFDLGCYVKMDLNGNIHIYQVGENEGEWNYVKMTEEFDVLTEVTFNPDKQPVTL